ncbi:hypothetical protein [Streptomyces sp. NPDC059080]|uniref:hypothetical protein n=1 Tax=Streptomyces sp. NPDC059080 TaxID=3346718 RepID=UPI0036A74BAB
MAYLIRPVTADEWKRLKELRLEALADPVARVAFHRTSEAALGWSWSLSEPVVGRVRVWVHEESAPAEGLYRALGFVPTGRTPGNPKNPAAVEREMALPRL